MKHKTRFNPNNRSSWFFVQDNMLLEQNLAWSNSYGISDALWRTSLGFIVYGYYTLRDGILSCFLEEDGHIQGYRYPGYGKEDFSRDQLTMALCALKIRFDQKNLVRIIDGLKYRISKKFTLTLDMELWIGALRYNSSLFGFLFCLWHITFMGLKNRLNKLIYNWAGIEQCSPEEQTNYPYRQQTRKEEIAFKLHFSSYARHLLAWQLYTTPDNILKKKACKIVLKGVPQWNLVVRMLLGDKVDKKDIEAYKPMTGYPWQNFVAKELYNMAEIIEYHWLYSKQYDSEENVLDNDILWYLYKKTSK